ncbi:MAG: hypothetical protein DMG13_22470 [Acidobacteria bacterium]|nr:MAG: hypothetical protein DMG13_22470 [Acidobacteriota bacterium]
MTRMARAHFGRQLRQFREHSGPPRHPRNPSMCISTTSCAKSICMIAPNDQIRYPKKVIAV